MSSALMLFKGARANGSPQYRPRIDLRRNQVQPKCFAALRQACSSEVETERAQSAFKISMIHGLQFTITIAFRCVRHRWENQEIHCQKLCHLRDQPSFGYQCWCERFYVTCRVVLRCSPPRQFPVSCSCGSLCEVAAPEEAAGTGVVVLV